MTHKNAFIAAAMILALCSCTSVNSLIDQMESAVENGDVAKAGRILLKIEEKTHDGEDLTPEQVSRVAEIEMEAAAKTTGKMLDTYSSIFGDDDD